MEFEAALMSEIVFIVEQAPEGGYIARALGESIFTEADTEADLKVAIQDAVHCHFDEGHSWRNSQGCPHGFNTFAIGAKVAFA